MNALAVLRALGPIDARNVGRDALLRWIVVIPVAVALAARWLLPLLIAEVEAVVPLPLALYYRPIMGATLVLLVPFMAGFVIGFLLLDQRDDGTLLALQVTPLSLNYYLLYRLTVPTLFSTALVLVVVPLSGLAGGSWPGLLVVALAAAPQAPIFALALAALAANKVQGFALMKASGVVMLPPLIAYFFDPPLQWLAAIFPTYWPAKLFWLAQSGAAAGWLYLLPALLYQLAVLFWLARRFGRIMHR